MEHFTIAVSDPRAVPFVRELLLSLPQVQLVEEPELSPEEEAREDAAAQAAYDRAKADPDQHSRPLVEVLRELDARPGYARAPLVPQPI